MTPLQKKISHDLQHREPHVSQNPLPHAWASEALNCSRQISLRMHEITGDGERDLRPMLAGKIGTFLHTLVQQALVDLFPGCQTEIRWDVGYLSGRADGLYAADVPTVVEIKTMGMRAFGRAVKTGRPSSEHKMQAELTALAKGAENVHVVYINRALDMRNPAMLEWEEPAELDLADIERGRLKNITTETREGVVSEAWYSGDVITDPYDVKWPCTYCQYRPQCSMIGPDARPLSEVEHLIRIDDDEDGAK